MGGDQGAQALLRDEAEEFGVDAGGRFGVEVAGGLVGQQQQRAVGERAGDGDALLFAARKLRRAVLQARFEAHAGEQVARALRRRGAAWRRR